MVTILLQLNKGRSSGRPSSEYPKILQSRKTGSIVVVDDSAQDVALGDEWGKPQPDVFWPKEETPVEQKPREEIAEYYVPASGHVPPEKFDPLEFPKRVQNTKTGEIITVVSVEHLLSLDGEWVPIQTDVFYPECLRKSK